MRVLWPIKKLLLRTSPLFVGLILTACGGGGAGSSTPTTQLSYTVATGAPFPKGATVTVTDSTGAVVGTSTIASSDGTGSVAVALSAVPPLVLVASVSDSSLTSMVSVSPSAANGTLNITPVTNLIAAILSPTGNPSNLASEIKSGSATVSTSALNTAKTAVNTILAPINTALSNTTDLMTGSFVANGAGYDRILDSLSIQVTPTSAGSNVEIGVKLAATSESAPASVIQITGVSSSMPISTLTANILPPIVASNLVTSGGAALIGDLLTRMTACFADAPSTRVSTSATTASGIIGANCLGIFYGNNPAAYLDNGMTVGNDQQWSTAFSSIFTNPTGVTVVWSAPTYLYTRPNGDISFSARRVVSTGDTSVQLLVARLDSNGKLNLIGNQSKYSLSVYAATDNLNFINMPQYSFVSTGYQLLVNNVGGFHSSTGDKFAKIIVTPPGSNGFVTLNTPAGYSYSGITTATTQNAGTMLRLAGQFLSASQLPVVNAAYTTPQNVVPSMAWVASQWSDTQIASIPNQGVWKFDLYTNASDSAPVQTEYRRTIGRAPTLSEITTSIVWPQLTAGMNSTLTSLTKTTGYFVPTTSAPFYFTADGTASGGAGWSVPTGAWAPTTVKLFGNYYASGSTTAIGFDDAVIVKTTIRSATIPCYARNILDLHCSSAKYLASGGTPFVGDQINSLGLFATDSKGRVNSVSLAFDIH
jgi:hypothetical protein